MAISLVVKGPSGQARRLDFDQAKVSVGSDPLCDICVDHPGVDGEQVVLVRRAGGLELFDIGETGGVLVNGHPEGHACLSSGDEIWVGGTVLAVAAEVESAVAFTESDATVRAEVAAEEADDEETATDLDGDDRFALLNRVRGLINSIGSEEDTYESILDTLFATVPVRRGFLALQSRSGDVTVKAHRSVEQQQMSGGPIEVSRTLVGRVLESGNAVLTTDAESDPRLQSAQSIHRLRIKAAICVPLRSADRVIGFLYGDNREKPGALQKSHLPILNALASVASATVETDRLIEQYDAKRKIEQALNIARSIQRNFLPSGPPDSDWLDMWGLSDSCDETGGDYYDFFDLSGGHTGVAIADVSGHGVGSALLMASVRSALRALVKRETPKDLVGALNNLVFDDVNDGRFITLFLARFNADTRRFDHVGAGHTPPIHYRARDGSTALLKSKGPPLGVLRGMEFPPGEPIQLERGDVLLFTTDGIMEATNVHGRQFGLDRLQALVVERAGGGARELVEAIGDAVDKFVGGMALHDDATLVAVKVR